MRHWGSALPVARRMSRSLPCSALFSLYSRARTPRQQCTTLFIRVFYADVTVDEMPASRECAGPGGEYTSASHLFFGYSRLRCHFVADTPPLTLFWDVIETAYDYSLFT